MPPGARRARGHHRELRGLHQCGPGRGGRGDGAPHQPRRRSEPGVCGTRVRRHARTRLDGLRVRGRRQHAPHGGDAHGAARRLRTHEARRRGGDPGLGVPLPDFPHGVALLRVRQQLPEDHAAPHGRARDARRGIRPGGVAHLCGRPHLVDYCMQRIAAKTEHA